MHSSRTREARGSFDMARAHNKVCTTLLLGALWLSFFTWWEHNIQQNMSHTSLLYSGPPPPPPPPLQWRTLHSILTRALRATPCAGDNGSGTQQHRACLSRAVSAAVSSALASRTQIDIQLLSRLKIESIDRAQNYTEALFSKQSQIHNTE